MLQTKGGIYILCGDINFDGMINLVDMVLTSKYLSGSLVLDSVQLIYADVTHDGIVNALDLVAFKKHLLDIELIQQVNHEFPGLTDSFNFIVLGMRDFIKYFWFNPVLCLGVAMWVIGCCISIFKRLEKRF